jgi:formylglycine-generating enzyme required for sulfatase activity
MSNNRFTKTVIVLAVLLLLQFSQDEQMVRIQGGTYQPMYGQTKSEQSVAVNDFLLDTYPVTNQQYLEFVKANPQWRKSSVKRVFADAQYLSMWREDLIPGEKAPSNSPVTGVSWFAARAFAKWCGKRLPTTDEWEFVARSNETRKDASTDSTFYTYLLSWYEKPVRYPLAHIGSTFKNAHGVYDMHGSVWEWTDDFNSIMLSGEGRKDKEFEKNLFCSGGAVGAKELMNYAGFMRYAFRSSLKGSYCLQNLGFRCAKDLPKSK